MKYHIKTTTCQLKSSPHFAKVLTHLSWCRQSDSNRRPIAYKAIALPTELCRHFCLARATRNALGILGWSFSVPPRSTEASTLSHSLRGSMESPQTGCNDLRKPSTALVSKVFRADRLRYRHHPVCLDSCSPLAGGARRLPHFLPRHKHWRKVRDSNPGRILILDGFQDRCNQPLCQLSIFLN